MWYKNRYGRLGNEWIGEGVAEIGFPVVFLEKENLKTDVAWWRGEGSARGEKREKNGLQIEYI